MTNLEQLAKAARTNREAKVRYEVALIKRYWQGRRV